MLLICLYGGRATQEQSPREDEETNSSGANLNVRRTARRAKGRMPVVALVVRHKIIRNDFEQP